MKKTIKLKSSIIFMFMFAFLFALFNATVKAAVNEITSLDVNPGNLQITVSGTTDETVTAVSIAVYKSDGSTLVKMKTSSVSDENKFSETIPLENGTYVVKVANYDGGQIVSKENVVVKDQNSEDAKNENEKQESNKNESKKQKSNTNKTQKTTEPDAKENNVEKTKETTKTETAETSSDSLPVSKNPKTSDNIVLFASMFVTCSLGSLAIIKSRKKK